jgi:hypothetical protein
VNTAPEAVELFAIVDAGTTAKLKWSVSKESDFKYYQLFASNVAGNPPDSLIEVITNQTTDSLSYTTSSPGVNSFAIFVHDRYGLSTSSDTVSVNLTQ